MVVDKGKVVKTRQKINSLLLKPHDGGWNLNFEGKQNCIPTSDLLYTGFEFLPSSLTSLSFFFRISWEGHYLIKMCSFLSRM